MLLDSHIDPERDFFFFDPGYTTPKSLRGRSANIHRSHLVCVMIGLNMCFLSVYVALIVIARCEGVYLKQHYVGPPL